MGALSPVHWLILLVLLVVLFGAKRLPDASRSIGRSLRIFKSEMKDMGNDDAKADSEHVANQPPVVPAPQQLPPGTTPVVNQNPAQHVQAERIEKAS